MTAEQDRLYWEDFRAGEAVDFGDYAVSDVEIAAFARAFDPDPAHLDPDSPRALAHGGLVAGDWHSCAMLMRMLCDDYLLRTAGAGAPGVEFVRWSGWVRPGDTLRARRTPLEVRASKSRPRIGIVRMLIQVFNQNGEEVLNWLPVQLVDRRDPMAEPPPPQTVPAGKVPAQIFRTPPSATGDAGDADSLRFDDVAIGRTIELGRHLFSTEDLISFATRYNPQYFHADLERAEASLYGGLIASGWHTAAVWNRLLVLHQLSEKSSNGGAAGFVRYGPSIAVVDMKWPEPVRPGDEITFSSCVVALRADERFPDWGIAVSENVGVNQRGSEVLNLRHEAWVKR